jgi:hypothetical protein
MKRTSEGVASAPQKNPPFPLNAHTRTVTRRAKAPQNPSEKGPGVAEAGACCLQSAQKEISLASEDGRKDLLAITGQRDVIYNQQKNLI